MKNVPVITWAGCYEKSWKGLITPQAFAHPAKFSPGLIDRIYTFGFAAGWWKIGDLVGDPFGGIAGGGIFAGYHGLNWIGCELEEKFVGLGNANLALHAAKWMALGQACCVKLLQGDSRRFAEIVGAATGIVTSPPYADAINRPSKIDVSKCEKAGRTSQVRNHSYGVAVGQISALPHGRVDAVLTSPPYNPNDKSDSTTARRDPRAERMTGCFRSSAAYGDSPGQIGRLGEGDLAAVVTSPPFGDEQPCASQTRAKKDYHKFTRGDGTKRDKAQRTIGNIAVLGASGSVDEAILSSDTQLSRKDSLPQEQPGPVDATSLVVKLGISSSGAGPARAEAYHEDELGMGRRVLRGRGLHHLVRGKEEGSGGPRRSGDDRTEAALTVGSDREVPQAERDHASSHLPAQGLPEQVEGRSRGVLGASTDAPGGHPVLPEADHSLPHREEGKSGTGSLQIAGAAARTDDVERRSCPAGTVGPRRRRRRACAGDGDWDQANQPSSPEERETYWGAMRTVYEQCRIAIRPGGVLVVVVKDCCKNGKRVPLCDQTLKLLQHLGFVPICRIHAMLTREVSHPGLFNGEPITRKYSRKSFFRRLAEKKGSPSIDWEEVLVVRRAR